MNNKKIIEIKDLSFSYSKIPVLDKINLSVEERDFIGVIGPNGGGKTTLLKLILGLLKPQTGTIQVFNTAPEFARKHIGYVPQYSETDDKFPITAYEVVALGLINKKTVTPFFNKKKKKQIDEIFEKLNINNVKNELFGNLTGGQKQRCLIARAIIAEPKILLLDEPTASVDSNAEIGFYNLLKELNNELSIIFVSHDLGFISSYVKKVACINKSLSIHPRSEIAKTNYNELYETDISIIKHKCGL